MKSRIDQARLRELYKEYKNATGKTQLDMAADLEMSRTTFVQLCSKDKEYKHSLDEATIQKIAKYFKVDPNYLTGESEFKNAAHFIFTSLDKLREARCIGEMLIGLGIVTPSEDKKFMRLSSKEDNDSIFMDAPIQIDMNIAEYSVFSAYLAEQIRIACDNYVKISSARKVYEFDCFDEESNFEDWLTFEIYHNLV